MRARFQSEMLGRVLLRLVAQIFTGWNRFEPWFGLVDGLKKAA
jgi:hypothetical protein